MKRKLLWWLGIPLGLILIFVIYFIIVARVPAPDVDKSFVSEVHVLQPDSNYYVYKNNWLRKSKSGLWEMYLEGKPFERGVINGKLAEKLVRNQEVYFVEMLNKLIPSKLYINFLKYFVVWFNRDLDENIDEEFKEEIYGVSQSFSHDFDFIGPAYYRILNYHAAHDIGHLVQELHLVGCTSFAAWGEKSADGKLIAGRNFDFFVGDKFAEDKIVSFNKPDKGHKFMMVTWGGMTGATSGMNEKGLAVTINAARSEIPVSTATPISIVAREVLQYASNIEEAYEIIRNRKTFVSQTFLIASAADKKAVVIDKAISSTGKFETDTNYILSTNHFQSRELRKDKYNEEHISETSTMQRYGKLKQLVEASDKLDYKSVASILRNTKGLTEKNIGFGNERAINQMQGHHSVIFKPEDLIVWVSTSPWNVGEYKAYDLKKIFQTGFSLKENVEITADSLTIPVDSVIYTKEFKDYLVYRKLKPGIDDLLRDSKKTDDGAIETFVAANPDFYDVHKIAGDYYKSHKNYPKAKVCYKIALYKSIPWKADSLNICENLSEIELREKEGR
jgi:isopenicillin-N N-acyltransferase like protein